MSTNMTAELSDYELHAQLVQHGVQAPVAAEWVLWRRSTFADEIERVLK
jgi:hypothetical protein